MKDSIYIAQIISTHGLNGAVKVMSYAVNHDEIIHYSPLFDEQRNTYKIEKIYNIKNNILTIKFFDFDNIELAKEKLVEIKLYIHKDQIKKNEGEFLFEELKGLCVYLEDKKCGKVVGVHNFGSCDILDIRTDNADIMLPFIDSYIKEVNKKYIVIYKLPEGV